MKTLVQGESGTRSTLVDVETKHVKVVHCWKKDKDATRYQLEFNYNFDVSLEEVYRLAALWVNKDFQNRMRSENYTEKMLADTEQRVISIEEMYAKKVRAEKDPVKAASNAINKLSSVERAALLAQLSAE